MRAFIQNLKYNPAFPTYTNSLVPPDGVWINLNNSMKNTAYWYWEGKRERACGNERHVCEEDRRRSALCWQSWVIRGKSPLKENIQRVINGFNKGAVFPFNRDKSSPSFSCADKTRHTHTHISFISPALDLKHFGVPSVCVSTD